MNKLKTFYQGQSRSIFMGLMLLFLYSGCDKNRYCDDNCHNGDCIEGDCVCDQGYEGHWCEDNVGSGGGSGGGGGGSSSGYVCSNSSCSYVSSGADYATEADCENNCGNSTGQLMIWRSYCCCSPGSTIEVYVNGSYVGGLDTYFSSAPSCGASNVITKTYPPGTYSISGECESGSPTWSGSMDVVAGACSKFELSD